MSDTCRDADGIGKLSALRQLVYTLTLDRLSLSDLLLTYCVIGTDVVLITENTASIYSGLGSGWF